MYKRNLESYDYKIKNVNSITNILAFGKQGKPEESDSMPVERTLGKELIIPREKLARIAGYA